MSRTLVDQVIVITGASSGIGAATALACARAGMDVVLNGRDAARLDEVAAQIRTLGRGAEIVLGDVTDDGMTGRLLDTAAARFRRFDVVLANAGYGFKRPMHETSVADLRQIFEVNFFAATELVSEAARRLIAAQRGGHLLMVSSALAKFTMINFAAYSASKAAQNHVCRAMRMELRPHGIAVSSVHPITTRTEFFARSAQNSGLSVARERLYDGVPRWLLQRPEQVADAIVRCLRRPTPEVWTSFPARLAAGIVTIFPRLMDRLGKPAGI